MTYERFEDLPVWKSAIELAEKVYALTEKLHSVVNTASKTNWKEQLCPSQIISLKDSREERHRNY